MSKFIDPLNWSPSNEQYAADDAFYKGKQEGQELYERLYKALDWVMHCHHDIGQAGTPPSNEEWDAALESAMEVLALVRKEKNNGPL